MTPSICLGILLALILIGTGCGKKDEALEAYKTGMSEFYGTLETLDGSINAIDPESEGSKEELLGYIDQMNEAYQKMGQLEVPPSFSGITDISVEAAEYMQKAAECYHLAYDGEFFSPYLVQQIADHGVLKRAEVVAGDDAPPQIFRNLFNSAYLRGFVDFFRGDFRDGKGCRRLCLERELVSAFDEVFRDLLALLRGKHGVCDLRLVMELARLGELFDVSYDGFSVFAHYHSRIFTPFS